MPPTDKYETICCKDRHGTTANNLAFSGDNVFNDIAGDVGEPKVPSTEMVRQLGMIDSHQVQDRGVKVMNVDFIFDSVESEIIGRSINKAALDGTSGHPHREATHIVIASSF